MNHPGKTVAESARKLCQAEQTPFLDTTTDDQVRSCGNRGILNTHCQKVVGYDIVVVT
jgi:hypothetical protein